MKNAKEVQNAASVIQIILFSSCYVTLVTLIGTRKSALSPLFLTVNKWRVKTAIQHLQNKGVGWTDCLATALCYPSNSENVCKE